VTRVWSKVGTQKKMSFSFSLSGDDIIGDDTEEVINCVDEGSSMEFMDCIMHIEPEFMPKLLFSSDLLVPQAPVRISFSFTTLDSDEVVLPKRDIYDVKYQLMKQERLSIDEEILIGETEDVRAATYEGGLKVWECTYDLIKVLGGELRASSILEMGCGAGLPSSYVLYMLFRNNVRNVKLVVADYNESILRLVTAPNMLLTWLNATGRLPEELELDITPELIAQFQADLDERGIELQYLSGAWSPQFVKLLPKFELILASETIYSPATLPTFTDVLLNCLDPNNGRALVAAKKIYFGVGGGIPEFVDALNQRGARHAFVNEEGEGVGRAVLKVTL